MWYRRLSTRVEGKGRLAANHFIDTYGLEDALAALLRRIAADSFTARDRGRTDLWSAQREGNAPQGVNAPPGAARSKGIAPPPSAAYGESNPYLQDVTPPRQVVRERANAGYLAKSRILHRTETEGTALIAASRLFYAPPRLSISFAAGDSPKFIRNDNCIEIPYAYLEPGHQPQSRAYALGPVLRHELIHALQTDRKAHGMGVAPAGTRPRGGVKSPEDGLGPYINQRHEVQAYVSQVIADLPQTVAPDVLSSGAEFQEFLYQSATYRAIWNLLNAARRRQFLQTLHGWYARHLSAPSAVEEEGGNQFDLGGGLGYGGRRPGADGPGDGSGWDGMSWGGAG